MVHLDPLDPGHLLDQTMVSEPGRTLRSSDPDPLEVLLIHQSGRVQPAGPRSGDFDSLRESQQEVVLTNIIQEVIILCVFSSDFLSWLPVHTCSSSPEFSHTGVSSR